MNPRHWVVSMSDPEPELDAAEALEWLAEYNARASAAIPVRVESCVCGKPVRCDPFRDVPGWPEPGPEWASAEFGLLDEVADLAEEVGSWEAALRVFARDCPGTRPRGSLPASPVTSVPESHPNP